MKEKLLRFWDTLKRWWHEGIVQRTSRITYDVIWNIILFACVIMFIGFFLVGGIGLGYFASLVKDEPIRDKESMAMDIYNYSETSSIYFAGEVYAGDIRSDLYREDTTLEEVSPVLIDAVIATEDEYFMEHEGIVPKAILRAMVQEFTNSSIQTGGSTLTQQLIKNQILTNEVSFERKAKEILLAMRLEQFFEKDEIMEAYLNIIPYGRNSSGRNIAGIQTASQGIFGVNANELSLSQAAYLAGLPQSPSVYTPFLNSGELKDEDGLQPGINRMKTVLRRMHEMNYITDEELNEALEYDIAQDFTNGKPSIIDQYPYLTFEVEKRAKNIIKNVLMEQDDITKEELDEDENLEAEYEELAERAMRMDGYEIHTTIDKGIYDVMQEVARNYENYGYDRTFTKTNDEGESYEVTERIQTGAVMIENSSGRIISFVGGRGHDEDHSNNYAFNTVRSIGSTSKPILVYGPAMEAGVVQPGTPIADYPRTFGNWTPKNYGGGNYGMISARKALESSYNIPAVDTYMRIVNEDPAANYLEKMGVTSLTEGDHYNLSFALGATDYGISVEETVNAYSTIGNGGKFSDGYMIEKIMNPDGEVIYEHESEPVDIFSPQTNYLTLDMMRGVVSSGTAGYLNSQLNNTSVDWAGKTGTSQNYHDAWFMGTNPNITLGTWIGYDTPYSINAQNHPLSYSHRNLQLWAKLINAAANENPELVTPTDRFERPGGIVERSYCAVSGMLPSELCEQAGLVKTDLFNEKFAPSEEDDSLISGSYVVVNGKSVKAGSNTPSEFVEGDGLMFNPEWLERKGYNNLNDISQLYPRTERDKWEKIAAPSGSVGSSIEDDGKAPASPTSLKKSGSNLTWNSSSSNDVVGYRVYRSSEPGGNFKKIGSTTSTSYEIGNDNGVYIVRAVDYFGKESDNSSEVIVGETSDKEEETPDNETNEESENDSEEDSNSNDENQEENSEEETDENNNEESSSDEE
ncbi:penicillin-binding protein [Oceanobacillus iheyensis HTE831]|uniref:Penicillin-binding protein n=2 Tax=Oceanobacillus iheyensis TaxID=182710 RepID=Q8EP95_OCEIH|nr:penicillin-binding protein [Oceanobacillus iheyensis HTE831]